ncbi:hypothetical protein JW823_10170 [bacterium]|nr:hypothetical protein [candidate division CSSED10-310 bacterium]
MNFHLLHGAFTDLHGPDGGDVSALLWSPDSFGRLWCGTVSGDLCFRDNHVGRWQRVEPPFRPMIKIEALETSPGARSSLMALSYRGNLALSTDNGKSWLTRFPELTDEIIRSIRHHPLHPGYVLAGTQTGLFCSPDSGKTWTRFMDRIETNAITAIAFDTQDPLTFFIADSDGFSGRILMTTNGGYSFEVILEGEDFFSQIHTLVYQESCHSLWAAGTGYGWRVARARIEHEITWNNLDNGLPVSAITCMTSDPDNRILIGSNGGGIYRYIDEKDFWRRLDIEPRRRYVRCVTASEHGVAAGFSENGVAMEAGGEWIEANENLFARNISRIQRFGNELLVVSDEQLFIRMADSSWKALPGFQLVQDVLAHGSRCYTSGLYSGIFRRSTRDVSWEDLDLPVSRALLVRTTSQGVLFVMTMVKRDRVRFYSFDPEPLGDRNPWRDCSQDLPIAGIVYDFAVDFASGTLFITVSTSRGIFCYDSYTDSWMPSQLPDNVRVLCLYRSRHSPDVLYAAAGRQLLKSLDFGRSFENEPIGEFPSKISSLTLSGLGFETIWVSTENGGVYVSHFPDCWNALRPDELSLPINQIAVDTTKQGVMYCGTRGISCWRLAIPSVSIRMEEDNDSKSTRLYLTLNNPGRTMEVDIHLLLIRPSGRSFDFLLMENHVFLPSTKPKPRRISLRADSSYPEIYIGDIPSDMIAGGTRPAVAICVPDHFHPICDIQIAPKQL